MENVTVIPKDCLVCDVCSDVLVEEDGKVVQLFTWTTWGLSCSRHKPVGDFVNAFNEGDVVPKDHILWAPLVITDWEKGRTFPGPGLAPRRYE